MRVCIRFEYFISRLESESIQYARRMIRYRVRMERVRVWTRKTHATLDKSNVPSM